MIAALAGCSAGPQPTGLGSGTILQKGGTVADIVRPAVDRAALDSFAMNLLNGMQAQSIAERREFCGYIYAAPGGGFTATTPKLGGFASCDLFAPQGTVVASYHTHGAFDFDYDNEVPSDVDLLGDFQFNLIGYISTPGGRFWRVDPATRRTDQICGLGCLVTDPQFIPRDEASVRLSYSVPDLQQRSAGAR